MFEIYSVTQTLLNIKGRQNIELKHENICLVEYIF